MYMCTVIDHGRRHSYSGAASGGDYVINPFPPRGSPLTSEIVWR